MPIDPEIALQGRPAHIAGPMEMYAQLLGLQHQQQQLELQKQSVGALADERRARAQQAQQAVKDTAALDQAYQPGLTREQVIDAVPGHMKALVGKHWDEADAAGLRSKELRAKADEADTDYAASLAAGVKPWLSRGPEQAMNAVQIALSHAKAQGHDVSTIEQHLQQNPESLPQILDSLIARSPKYSELQQKGALSTEKTQAEIEHIKAQTEAARRPAAPKGAWVPDYDANNNPISRWVEEGPGAVAPRQEAPTPLTVLAPNTKAVDRTGATVAEGNPLASVAAKEAALARVDTVNDAGQPVTKFVQPAAGMELPKPDAAVTRPREVKPGSEEAYFIAYAKKLGKRPDDLTLEEQSRARQSWSRADDKPSSASDDAGLKLTPAGMDAAARNYAVTGNLPPMGMGKAAADTKAAIVNRAAAMYPDLDLAANSADYRSNRGSLVKMQAQRDALGAFEQTAGKNIKIFLDAAGKVVDTGSPMANSVARMISGKMLGSENQAAYDAARLVAINEVAKITNNPNLTGALSDSARQEVEAFNPKDATLKQTVAVFRVLQQDMANRPKAMDEQIAAIRGRIKGGAGETGSSAKPAATPAAPAGPAGLFSYQDYLKQKGK